MRRSLITLILLCLCILPAPARTVRGSVKGEGKPLDGVVVSDGFRFTRTGADGRFSLSIHKNARFVFVVTPSGYVADFSSGVPEFFKSVSEKKFDFDLLKTSDSEDFTIFSVSDPQMRNHKQLKRFKGRPLGDLRGMAKVYGEKRPTVGIALGDIAWNRLEMFEPYKKAIATTGIPFYSVIGNHDFIQTRKGVEAASEYEKHFGPVNYAFFLGRDLVIGVNNIIFNSSGLDNPEISGKYVEGYSEETLGFVRGLMGFVPKETHIFLAQHSPIRFIFETKRKDIEGADEMLSILSGHEVDILSGHTHVMNKIPVCEGVTDNNAAAIGGAWWATDYCRDGTPRGYEIISSEDGSLSFLWHNIDYPDDFQVEFTGLDKAPRHRNSVLACAWAADSSWTATWTQDGVEMGSIERVIDYSRSYTEEIIDVYEGDFGKIPGFKKPSPQRHYFSATPSQYASVVTMTVTAPDSRSWTHTFDLRGSYIDLQASAEIPDVSDYNLNTLVFGLDSPDSGIIDLAENGWKEKGRSPLRYSVELRCNHDDVQNCEELLAHLLSKNLGDRLTVSSSDSDLLEFIHSRYPEISLSFLTTGTNDAPELLSGLSFVPRWWSPDHSGVTRENVAYCHALGIRVSARGADEIEDIERMVSCGVDAIVSACPAKLVTTVRKEPADVKY